METQSKCLKVSVFGYKPNPNDKSKITYNISITFNSQSWIIMKRYSEFDDLQNKLKVCFNNSLPLLPKKTYTSFLVTKSHDDIEGRRLGLDKYLNALISKPEIVASTLLKEFLQLEEHAKELVVNQPLQVYEFNGFLHGVSDFSFCANLGVLFVVTSDYSIFNRLDAYLTNMKGPWEKENGESVIMPVGCVECWTLQQDGQYERQWAKMYHSQSVCCYWDPAAFVLLVGLDNGCINYLEVPYSQGFKKFETNIEIEQHTDRVTSVHFESERGLIHSISKDQRYKIRKTSNSTLIYDNEISPFELTDMVLNKKKTLSIIADKNGYLYLFDIKNQVVQLNFINTNVSQLGWIMLQEQNLFGIGMGEIVNIDVGEKNLRIVESINTKTKSNCVCWSAKRQEIFVGTCDGTIQFWDFKQKKLICIVKGHESEITSIQWIESEQHLLTASKDKQIKIWELPNQWKQ